MILPKNSFKILTLVVLALISCNRSSPSAPLDPELEALLYNFVKEGATHGIRIDTKDLLIQFGNIDGKKSASCQPNSVPKVITLDQTTWRHINYSQKEALFYHELAHCLLMRPHYNETFELGECKSWMREDESICNIDLSNSEWRRYYLEELFIQSKVSTPFWYLAEPKFKEVKNLQVTKSFAPKTYQFEFFDSLLLNEESNWILNFKATRSEGSDHLGIIVNGITIDASFVKSWDLVQPKLVIYHSKPGKIVFEATSTTEDIDLYFLKQGGVLFIYFNNKICYRIPADPKRKWKVGATSSFPTDSYSIKFFAE